MSDDDLQARLPLIDEAVADVDVNLQDHDWRGYYPGNADHVSEIIIPALTNSVRYDRITGAFASSVLSILSYGLAKFLENGGRIRLIPGVTLYERDVEAIESGLDQEVMMERVNWEELQEQPEKVVEALSWLVASGRMEIKIGTVTDEEGNPQPAEEAEWHQKGAIFTDSVGDSIAFGGSMNESAKGLSRNRESIHLNRSWVEHPTEEWDEKKNVQVQRDEFEALWNGEDEQAKLFDVPTAVEEELLRYFPDSEPDWGEVAETISSSERRALPTPRDYQQHAVDKIVNGDGRLLIEHATGTGKSWTALFALRELVDPSDVIVVLAPRRELLSQWASESNIRKFFPDANLFICSGDFDWRRPLFNALTGSRAAPVFAVSTMHPSTMGDVLNLISSKTNRDQRILLADEVHNVGAKTRRGALKAFKAGKARIGLSATVERNDEGDQFIQGYFGNEVDRIGLEEAIYEHGVLSEYEYHFDIVSLSVSEREEYGELSDDIGQLYQKYKEYEGQSIIELADYHGDLRSLLQKRAAILKECEAKTLFSEELIDEIGDRTLVFCNTKPHAASVKEALSQATLRSVGLYHSDLSRESRDRLLKLFERGRVDVLVSIDCLTEGVDIPACDSAILISNSTSAREGVQRRGRVLRQSEDAGVAVIHDFVVLPTGVEGIESGEAELKPHEVRMVGREIERAIRMNEAAVNRRGNRAKCIGLRGTLRRYE